jgi:hypothetical protein
MAWEGIPTVSLDCGWIGNKPAVAQSRKAPRLNSSHRNKLKLTAHSYAAHEK